MRRRQLYSTAWCLAGEKSLRGFKKWHNLEITLSFLSFWPPWIISHLSLAVEGSRLCSELWNTWEENLGTSCTPHSTEILDSFPSALTHILGFKEKTCASEKDVTNSVLLHKACVTLSNFSKKNKQNLTCTIDCQNSLGYKKHQVLLCSGDKGVQSNPSTIHTYRGLNDMRNTVKIPWKKNCSDSQPSLCFPSLSSPLVFSVTMENISCSNVCSPHCLHLLSPCLHLCYPNTDLLRDDILRSEPAH